MRRLVALFAAAFAAITWAGSSHAATTVDISHPEKSVCSSVEGCVRASLWLNKARSPSELPTGSIMIVTPELAYGTAMIVPYHRGESLRSLIAHNGRHAHAVHAYHGLARHQPVHTRRASPATTIAKAESKPADTVAFPFVGSGAGFAAAAPTSARPAPAVSLSKVIATGQASFAKLQAQVADLTDRLKASQTTVTKLESDLTQTKSDVTSLTSRLDALQADVMTRISTLQTTTASSRKDTAVFTPLPHYAIIMAGAPLAPWMLALAAIILVLLVLLAGIGIYATFAAMHERRARRTSAPNTRRESSPEATYEIRPGTRIPFAFAEGCLTKTGQFEPSFGATVTKLEATRIHEHGNPAKAGHIILGYGPWDVDARDPGKPVSLGRVTAAGPSYYTASLTQLIAKAVRQESDVDQARAARIRAWLALHELTIDPTAPEIVVTHDPGLARAA